MPTPPRENEKPSDEYPDGQGVATPDEAGPHDVPDERVIEKTLPTKPVKDNGPSSSAGAP